jgi:hypothetical protein
VLGPPADGFVLQGERHAQQQGSLPLPHRPNNGGGCARWTPHGGDYGISVQHEPHITYDITSWVMSPASPWVHDMEVRDSYKYRPIERILASEYFRQRRNR